MSNHKRVEDLIETLLRVVAAEITKPQPQLGVELESVVIRGVLEAFRRGKHAQGRRVTDIIEIILCAIAEEDRTTQERLGVEVEAAVTRGVVAAFKRGEGYAHEAPTEPPPDPALQRPSRSQTPPGPLPTFRPPPPRKLPPQAQPTRKIPTPIPRQHKKTPMPRVRDRRRDDED